MKSGNGLHTSGWCHYFPINFHANYVIIHSTYFRLDPKLETVLAELGVELVEDLDTIFHDDEGLLCTIRDRLPKSHVDAFIKAYNSYSELVGDTNSTGSSAVNSDSFCMVSSVDVSSMSLEEKAKTRREAQIYRRIDGIIS